MSQTKTQLLGNIGSGFNVTGVLTATSFTGEGQNLSGIITTGLGNQTIAGNLTLDGNLTVKGSQTIINSDTLDVQDKTVGIASTSTPTSATQNNSGIEIYGPSNVTIKYEDPKGGIGINTGLSVTGFGTFSGALSGDTVGGYKYEVAPYGNTTSLIVTVADKISGQHRYHGQGSSKGYVIDGYQAPFLTLTPGRTYRFDQSDSSNDTHQIKFYLEADKTTLYETGVTYNGTAGNAGAYTQIVVGDETPIVLFYQCINHGYMGNAMQNNSSSLITSNKVGIGEVAPANLLHVKQSDVGLAPHASAQIVLERSGTNYLQFLTANNGTSGVLFGDTADNDGAKIVYDHNVGQMQFNTGTLQRLRITEQGGFNFTNNELVERVNITGGKLSDNQNINLDNGMVHYFTTQETTTSTPNITASAGINTIMSDGDTMTVTVITTAAAGAYSAQLTIEGAATTENWIGGEVPAAGGSSGVDIYSYTIIKTGSAAYTVIGNLSKTSA